MSIPSKDLRRKAQELRKLAAEEEKSLKQASSSSNSGISTLDIIMFGFILYILFVFLFS